MKKALIIFQSKRGANIKFGEEIAQFLMNRGLAVELIPISNFEPKKLEEADYLLLSSWERDSVFTTKQPNIEWAAFVNKLPTLDGIKTALFTTYKFFSGSTLRSMKKYLGEKAKNLAFTFKSKDGSLSISDKLTLNEFIG
jgi:menaquinone-dependent protoporphyrinogen IX oxidase